MSYYNFDNFASSDEDLTPSPPPNNIELSPLTLNEFVGISHFENFGHPNSLFASADLFNNGEVPELFSSGVDDFNNSNLDPSLSSEPQLPYNVFKNTLFFHPPPPPPPETHAGLRHFPISPTTYAMPETGLEFALHLPEPTAHNPLTMLQTGCNYNMNEDAYRALYRAASAESSIAYAALSDIAGPSSLPYPSQPKRTPRAASSGTVSRRPRNAVASSSIQRSESPESPALVSAARKQPPRSLKRKADVPEDEEWTSAAPSKKKRRVMKEENENRKRKEYPCESCPKICWNPSDLRRHMQSLAHSEPSFICDECGCALTREDALKRHQKKMHKSHRKCQY